MFTPFLYIGLGILLGFLIKKPLFYKFSGFLSSLALYLLLFSIGLGIGKDEALLRELPSMGLSSLIISGMAVLCSVGLSLILAGLLDKKNRTSSKRSTSSLKDMLSILLLPLLLGLGVLLGTFLTENINTDLLFNISLFLLYVSLGVSQRNLPKLLKQMKGLGLKIVLLPLMITVGSILGGFLGSLLTPVDVKVSVLSSAGLGYYSLTGAFLTTSLGVEAGSIGFMTNVFRDILTVLLLPLYKRLGIFSAVASGAGGCMDTMLGPITKTLGEEHLLLVLSVGTLLTVLVPFLLPFLLVLL